MYICICVSLSLSLALSLSLVEMCAFNSISMCICMYVFMPLRMHVYAHIYIYIYIHLYAHVHMNGIGDLDFKEAALLHAGPAGGRPIRLGGCGSCQHSRLAGAQGPYPRSPVAYTKWASIREGLHIFVYM